MENVIKYIKSIEDEIEVNILHHRKVLRWSIPIFIAGFVEMMLANFSHLTWENNILSISLSALFIYFIVYYLLFLIENILILFKAKICSKSLDWSWQERIEHTLGSFLFFTNYGNFEKKLKWFNSFQSSGMKFVLGNVILEQLNRAFKGENVIQITNIKYADHSSILSKLLNSGVKNICFTCIKSPKNWFLELDKEIIKHEELIESNIIPELDENKLKTPDVNGNRLTDNNWNKYPLHYIQFLNHDSRDSKRRRIFILSDDEWSSLVDKDNIDYFNKFIYPCFKKQIDTRFVKLSDLNKYIEKNETEIVEPLYEAIKQNVTFQDYDVFENSAVLIYDEHNKRLEFKIGSSVSVYSGFMEKIFSGDLKHPDGVYNVSEILDLFGLSSEDFLKQKIQITV